MITVFTPAYNRAYKLSELYESLCRQTYRDFEWLVVDDGSTDETKDLLRRFEADGRVVLRHVRQENGGKHRAINRGVRLAQGEWFFIVDSDDSLPPDSLELVAHYADQIADDPAFAGVSGSKCYPDGRKVGGEVVYDVLDTDAVSFRERLHVRGDMAEVWRTDVLRQYPFPEFPGEKFVSEGIVWSEIARHYKLRYFNRGIYTCDYLPDGLTRNIRRHYRQSPRGAALLYGRMMRDGRYGWKSRVRAAINYWRYTVGQQDVHRECPPAWWAWGCRWLGYYYYQQDLRNEKG